MAVPDLVFLHVRKYGYIRRLNVDKMPTYYHYQRLRKERLEEWNGRLIQDFKIVVHNQRNAHAIGPEKNGVFKLIAFYKNPQRYVPVPIPFGGGRFFKEREDAFITWDRLTVWIPWIYSQDVAVDYVTVVIPELPSGSKVSIRFEVDSCSCPWDKFMPYYCRVKESREDNNFSEPILVTIP